MAPEEAALPHTLMEVGCGTAAIFVAPWASRCAAAWLCHSWCVSGCPPSKHPSAELSTLHGLSIPSLILPSVTAGEKEPC